MRKFIALLFVCAHTLTMLPSAGAAGASAQEERKQESAAARGQKGASRDSVLELANQLMKDETAVQDIYNFLNAYKFNKEKSRQLVIKAQSLGFQEIEEAAFKAISDKRWHVGKRYDVKTFMKVISDWVTQEETPFSKRLSHKDAQEEYFFQLLSGFFRNVPALDAEKEKIALVANESSKNKSMWQSKAKLLSTLDDPDFDKFFREQRPETKEQILRSVATSSESFKIAERALLTLYKKLYDAARMSASLEGLLSPQELEEAARKQNESILKKLATWDKKHSILITPQS